MKYKGRTIKGPNTKIIPIIRSEDQGGNIIFKVQGVIDLEPFYKICPQPKPPFKIVSSGKKVIDVDNKIYKDSMDQWWNKRTAWIAINSLKATEGLEWETVDFSNPDTWLNWQKELQDSDFADAELGRILNAVLEVNGISEALVEEARQSFLVTQAQEQEQSDSPMGEQKTTPSGEPVKEPESNSLESQGKEISKP